MNKCTLRRFFVLLLSFLFFMSAPLSIRADKIADMQREEENTKAAISSLEKLQQETKNAISSLQSQRQTSAAEVNELQGEKASLTASYNSYASQIEDLNDEIDSAQSDMSDVSAQIVSLDKEIQENEARQQKEYLALKSYIKASYENGTNMDLIFTIFSAGSLEDILTRVEYVDNLVSYEQRLLADFKKTGETLQEKKAALDEKQNELQSYQDTLDEKEKELLGLTGDLSRALSGTNAELSAELAKLAGYDTELSALDAQMKKLQSQAAAAQAELAKQVAARLEAQIAAGQKEDTSGSYAASDSELSWLAATIQAEADGESYTGKLAVGTVIMNRVKSSSFPNTVVGVITQNMQFASYRSGKVELIMNKGPNSTCMQAAQEVLNGARVGDYLFFMTKYYADYYGIPNYTMIGNHAFFYSWYTGNGDSGGGDTTPADTPTDNNKPSDEPDNSQNNTSADSEEEDTPDDLEEDDLEEDDLDEDEEDDSSDEDDDWDEDW